jgi:hypothetical protein
MSWLVDTRAAMDSLGFATVLLVALAVAVAAPSRADNDTGQDATAGHVVARHAASSRPGTELRANKDLPYPSEVALIDEPSAWTYRQNPTRLALYYSDADPPGKSTCFGVCNWSWIPLWAPSESKPLGDWSIIVRDDGQHQWTFKRHPLYTHIHDTPDLSLGTGAPGWHMIPRFPQPPASDR